MLNGLLALVLTVMFATFSLKAEAKSATDFVSREREKFYPLLKAEILRKVEFSKRDYRPIKGEPVDLLDCGGYGENITIPNNRPLTHDLAQIAREVVFIESELSKTAYPRAAWTGMVAEYEQARLARPRGDGESIEAFSKRLAKSLNAYRRATKAKLPVVKYIGGCGAGETIVQISAPGASRVEFMAKLFDDICKKFDLQDCDYWQDYVDDPTLATRGALLSGRLVLRATWNDGAVLRNVDVDTLPEDSNGIRRVNLRR